MNNKKIRILCNFNIDLTIKLKQEDNWDKSLVNLFIKTGEISGMMKAITPAISDFVKQKHSSKVAKFKPKISSQISKFNKESSVLNNSESLSKFRSNFKFCVKIYRNSAIF